MKKQRIALKVFTNTIMFTGFIAAIWAVGLVDTTEIPVNRMFSISIGVVSLLGLSVLFLVHMMDTAPDDLSSQLFFWLIGIAYFGIISDNIIWIIPYCLGSSVYSTLYPALQFSLITGSFLMMPLLLALCWHHQNYVFIGESGTGSRLRIMIDLLAAADFIFLLIGSATHFIFYIDPDGTYFPGDGMAFAFIYPIIVILCCVAGNIRKKLPLKEKYSLIAVGVMPAAAFVFMLVLPDYSFVYVMVFINLTLIYGTVHVQRGIQFAENSKRIAEQNQELVIQQTQIMISQIQPHFLYNTLTAIHQLCDIDTELAQKTIQDFSSYLRGNMDGIKSTAPIPFEKEFAHTQTYLAIEQLRFSDILSIEYDIQVSDFELPALTLQPLAENAVKYGIRSREDGGTVSIATRRENGRIFVSVHDDGMGFDPDEPKNDGRSHIGLENTRKRLQLMMNAQLRIESEIGVGTTVTIILEDNNESAAGR